MTNSIARTELSILRPDALPADVHRVVTDVVQQGYAGVVVPPVWVSRVVTMVRGTRVRATVTSTVSFPHGTSKPTVKAIEATAAVKDGADALLVVPHLPNVMRSDVEAMRVELLEIARAARAAKRDVMIHLCVEAVSLTDATVHSACDAARQGACDGLVARCQAQEVRTVKRYAEALAVLAMSRDATGLQGVAELVSCGADRVVIEAARG
jgi:deoxyribose-phosphate aldolase